MRLDQLAPILFDDARKKAWSPLQLSNLVLWLRARTITGLNDGDAITTWEDESGAGNDVTQGTADKRPTYQTAELNSNPIVRFDGSNDVLLATLAALIAAPNSILIVAKDRDGTAGSNQFYVGCLNNASAASFTIFSSTGGGVSLAGYNGAEIQAILLDTSWHYSDWVGDGASSVIRVDGVDKSDNLGSLDIRYIGIGAAFSEASKADVDIAEVVITSDALTSAELDLWDAYCQAIHGL